MTPDQERIAIETRFQTNWLAATPIGFENFPFRLTASDVEWVELFVIHNNEENISIGDAPSYRRYGLININVYVKKHTGGKAWRVLAENAAVIFRNQEFSSITCRTAHVEQVGDEEEWYKANVTIDFFTTT